MGSRARRYADRGQRDANEPALFAAARKLGVSIYPTVQPLDAVAYWRGSTFLVEVKVTGAKRRTKVGSRTARLPSLFRYPPNTERLKLLSEAQREFTSCWPGPWVVVYSEDELLQFAKWLRGDPIVLSGTAI